VLGKYTFALNAAAYAFTAWRLIARGLPKRQPALLVFLLLRCLLAWSSVALTGRAPLYFWSYVLLTPFDSLVSILAVRESLGLVLYQYPGIRSLGRWTMYGAVSVSLLVAVVITAAYWRGDSVRSNLYYIEVGTRSIAFGLAVVVASLLVFLSYYRLDLSRNRIVSSVAFGCVVLAEAVTLFIDSNSVHLVSPLVDNVNGIFGTMCVLLWGLFLEREEVSESRAPRPPRMKDERNLRQLQALEQFASRIGR